MQTVTAIPLPTSLKEMSQRMETILSRVPALLCYGMPAVRALGFRSALVWHTCVKTRFQLYPGVSTNQTLPTLSLVQSQFSETSERFWSFIMMMMMMMLFHSFQFASPTCPFTLDRFFFKTFPLPPTTPADSCWLWSKESHSSHGLHL